MNLKDRNARKVRGVIVQGTIKKCIIGPECADISFDGLKLEPWQYEKIASLIQEHEEVEIEITALQGKLFEDEDEEKEEK